MYDIILPSLRDNFQAKIHDEPGPMLDRSYRRGDDLRITRFDGGNTLAKVKHKHALTGGRIEA